MSAKWRSTTPSSPSPTDSGGPRGSTRRCVARGSRPFFRLVRAASDAAPEEPLRAARSRWRPRSGLVTWGDDRLAAPSAGRCAIGCASYGHACMRSFEVHDEAWRTTSRSTGLISASPAGDPASSLGLRRRASCCAFSDMARLHRFRGDRSECWGRFGRGLSGAASAACRDYPRCSLHPRFTASNMTAERVNARETGEMGILCCDRGAGRRSA